MSGDKRYLLADDIVRCGHCLLGIASIVGDNQIELFAEYSAFGIDVGNRHFGAVRHLLTQSRVRTGDPSPQQ